MVGVIPKIGISGFLALRLLTDKRRVPDLLAP